MEKTIVQITMENVPINRGLTVVPVSLVSAEMELLVTVRVSRFN